MADRSSGVITTTGFPSVSSDEHIASALGEVEYRTAPSHGPSETPVLSSPRLLNFWTKNLSHTVTLAVTTRDRWFEGSDIVEECARSPFSSHSRRAFSMTRRKS